MPKPIVIRAYLLFTINAPDGLYIVLEGIILLEIDDISQALVEGGKIQFCDSCKTMAFITSTVKATEG